ncbi:hypothetical protein GCM10025878_04070 [Leuconostoc gasicomitatum]|uniref:Membrane protein, putative n=1 Tax=Leuconostoc inhae TaxID=178001 RepID=A0AAN2UGW7_9LACO|nr:MULTISPECIES: YfhO family protein [Leuconostoc]MBZ5947174.1 YfhO family protein [Leuconostoc gasicomitatum]MBZ5956883.1 YfhO family protein [Leuconostoc gasicomitatum]MBZ5960597.1 YfhO family protein [Leuconostoc gasicomitatum]MBZ5966282.1 YfhO family protein [Leuconostoc gasicomitatum]MBZ5979997.1 YfhO family protein [Leuconostoc gasicomitatum]
MRWIKKITWWQLLLIFLILAIASMGPQIVKQTMYMNSWDVPFHLSRMYELTKGFENGKWLPDISAYTFGQNGYGVNLFYGYSFTYLVALIYFWTHQAITAVLAGYIILLTTAMGLNYYAGSLFFTGGRSKLKSFAFSTLYVLAPVTFGQIKVRGLPGELIGILLFPAVLAAFYAIMFTARKSWVFASIVSTITVTNHVLSALLLLIVLTIMFIVFLYKKQATTGKLWQLVKAGILTLLLSAFYVMPFIQQILSDKIAGANVFFQATSVWDSISSSISNQATLNWTAIPVGVFVFVMSIVVVLGLLYTRSFSNHVQIIGGWLAISLIAIFYTPIEILTKTPLHVFQMMGRFYPIIMLLGLLFVIEGLEKFSEIGLLKQKTVGWLFVTGIVLAIFSAWKMQVTTYYNGGSANIANYQVGKKQLPKTVSNADFDYQIQHYYQLPLGSKDYLGQGRVKFVNNYQVGSWGDNRDAKRIYIDGKLSSLQLTHKGYVFTVANVPTSAKQVLLPMTNYKGWQVIGANNKILPITTIKGKMAVDPKGNRTLHLTYHKTLLHRVAIMVSAISVVVLLVVGLMTYFKRR